MLSESGDDPLQFSAEWWAAGYVLATCQPKTSERNINYESPRIPKKKKKRRKKKQGDTWGERNSSKIYREAINAW
jgi:hypothetical protein